MLRLVIPRSQRTRTAAGKAGIGSLMLAALLWAVVMVLGVWDYYIIKFPPCHLPKIYQEVLMPVVKVRAGISTGSGVIIETTNEHESTQIYVLTAAHVVEDEREVQVIVYSYHQACPNRSVGDTKAPSCLASCLSAFVVMTDTVKDLALLRINGTQISADYRDIIYTAKLAPKDYKPYLFTEVYAVGCSLGLNPRPSEGIITAVGPDATVGINSSPGARYLEISAPILPGNSGGGVFLKETRPNDRGYSAGQAHELIGITVWVRVYRGQLITTMTGIVPINQVYNFLEECGAVIPLGAGLRCRSVYEFLNKTPLMSPKGPRYDAPLGLPKANCEENRLDKTPGVNSEEDKRQGKPCWSGRGSECAIGIRGPGGPTLLTKGGEKSWQ